MSQPDWIGGYRVERLVGTGAFASVWLARDTVLDSLVAIKVLADNWSRDEGVRERFFEEARLLRRLDDDHVVRVFAVGALAEEQPYMVMEWADRGTLLHRLGSQPDGRLSGPEALRLGLGLLDGLAVLHSMGVVHRDVTPSNVLYKTVPAHRHRSGEEPEAVLLGDLGLAKDLRAASGFTLSAGTPGYMAPEQRDSLGIVDHRADIYALCALLQRVLVGAEAFERWVSRPGQAAAEELWELADEASGVEVCLLEAVERGLAQSPEDRFSDAWEMSNALRKRAVDHGAFTPGTPPRRARSRPGRPRSRRSQDGAQAAAPTNLPDPASAIIGREHELAEMAELLRQRRVVTLTGAGGVGKTRLALAVGRAHVTAFADGAWWVDLPGVTGPGAVAHEVLSRLAIPARAGQEPLDTLVSALAGQQRLVILDGGEHVIEGCAALADTVARQSPGTVLLLTSREPLHIDGESVYRVPSLSLPPSSAVTAAELAASGAVALFLERASAQQRDFRLTDDLAPAVASLCRRLDGMPLALELAAARLGAMSLPQVLERLQHRFALLTGGSRVALPRHRTLRGTVDWSYNLLSEVERAVFRRLSIFTDGFDLEAVEHVCVRDENVAEVVDALSSLVDKSLVVAEVRHNVMRYRLLETLQEYAAERLAEHQAEDGRLAEGEQLGEAHSDYYLSVAERAGVHMSGPDASHWLKRLDGELGNLHAAMDRTIDRATGAEKVLDQFWALRWFWSDARHPAKTRELLSRAMAAAGTSLTPLKQGQALLCQGRLLYLYDRRLELELMLAALQLARQAGDPLLEQKALCECCRAHLHNGNLADALSHGEQAVALSRQLGDPVMLGAALAPYAEALHYQGAPGTAAVYLEALDLAERAGSAQTAAGLHNNYAMLLIDDGDLSGARRHLERALQWMGNEMTNRTMPMYAGLGWVVMQTGDAMKSAAYQADVLRAASLNGNVFMAACAVLGLACCASRRGESELAARLHGAADSLLSPVAQQWETLEANIREADIIDLRTRLGDGYETIYQEGKALPYPEVVKLGLGAR